MTEIKVRLLIREENLRGIYDKYLEILKNAVLIRPLNENTRGRH